MVKRQTYIITIIILLLVIAAVSALSYFSYGFRNFRKWDFVKTPGTMSNEDPTSSDELQFEYNNSPHIALCASDDEIVKGVLDDGTKYLEQSITAYVYPEDATNKAVDWEIDEEKYSNKIPESEIQVIPEFDGSCNAKIRVFTNLEQYKHLKVIAKTRQGNYTASCLIKYVGRIHELSPSFSYVEGNKTERHTNETLGEYFECELQDKVNFWLRLDITDYFGKTISAINDVSCSIKCNDGSAVDYSVFSDYLFADSEQQSFSGASMFKADIAKFSQVYSEKMTDPGFCFLVTFESSTIGIKETYKLRLTCPVMSVNLSDSEMTF